VACIAGATGELKYKVIAEVFAGCRSSSCRGDGRAGQAVQSGIQQAFGRAYEAIANAALTIAVARNAKTNEPSVRNTFVILASCAARRARSGEEAAGAASRPAHARVVPLGCRPLWASGITTVLAAADVDALLISSEVVLRWWALQFGPAAVADVFRGLSDTRGQRELGHHPFDELISRWTRHQRLPRPTPRVTRTVALNHAALRVRLPDGICASRINNCLPFGAPVWKRSAHMPNLISLSRSTTFVC
jgi:hypothetical protein